jgi:hypothetical protein
MNKPQSASMYESAKKIYPREIGGRFANLSKIATVTLLGLFYAVPWLNWDERQAILFDLPARKFHLVGLTLWPQDFPYLALLLIIAALHRGAIIVLLHSARWPTLVRLCMSADSVDGNFHLDGAVDRGHAFAAHEAR